MGQRRPATCTSLASAVSFGAWVRSNVSSVGSAIERRTSRPHWKPGAAPLQGNRLNRLCNEHPDQVLVIPPCALAAKAERLLSRRAADQVLRHVPDGREVGRGV